MDSQTRRVKAHDRHLQALELRKAGATYQVIADQLGYASPRGAHKAVASALKATLREPADGLRELELARLDSALLAIWRRVQSGDDKAIDRLVRIMERRAKLLGLDEPPRTKVTLTLDDIDREIARLEAELKAQGGTP
jgi:hypothetical protein